MRSLQGRPSHAELASHYVVASQHHILMEVAMKFRELLAICVFAGGCVTSSTSPKSAGSTVQETASTSVKDGNREVQASDQASPAKEVIPNAKTPLPGVLAGGKPSDEDLANAQKNGYRTVVSLLAPEEVKDEEVLVKELGMRFVSIPISSPSDLTEANAKMLGTILDDPQTHPVIVHCQSGNRAGALLALYAFFVQHQSAEAAIELGVSAGLSKLRPSVEEIVSSNTPQ